MENNQITITSPTVAVTVGVKKYIISWYRKDENGEPKGPMSRTFKKNDLGGLIAWWGYLKSDPANISVEPKPILTDELEILPEPNF